MWNFMAMSLPSIRVSKSQRMQLVVHVACMGEERNVWGFGGET